MTETDRIRLKEFCIEPSIMEAEDNNKSVHDIDQNVNFPYFACYGDINFKNLIPFMIGNKK